MTSRSLLMLPTVAGVSPLLSAFSPFL